MLASSNFASATSALRLLQGANRDLAVNARRIASGLRVADAKDDPSVWRAATELRSDVRSLSAIQEILGGGQASVATASNALASTRAILGEMKSALIGAKGSGADFSAIQSGIAELNAQLRATASAATFGGTNLVSVDTGAPGYASRKTLVSGTTRSAGGVQLETIGFDTDFTKLFDDGSAASGILQRRFDLPAAGGGTTSVAPSPAGLSGTSAETPGKAASTPALGGLNGAAAATAGLAESSPAAFAALSQGQFVDGTYGSAPTSAGLSGNPTGAVVGQAAGAATAAKAVVGTLNTSNTGIKSGDTVQLAMTVNGVAKTVKVYQRTIENAATLKTELQRAIDAEYGTGKLVADVAADNTISIESVAKGTGESVSVTGVTVVDGNDVTTSTLALQTQTGFSTLRKSIDGALHYYDSLEGLNLAGLDKGDRLRFTYDARYADGVSSYSHTITVSLANVTSGASLAAAINQEIVNETRFSASHFAGATFDGTNILFYQKNDESGIRVREITAINGNGTVAGNLGFTTGSATGGTGAAATAASIRTGSDFSGTITVEDGASLGFRIGVEGSSSAEVKVTRAVVDQALGASAGGAIASIGQLASAVQAAMQAQGVTGFTVAADGNRLKFTKTGTAVSGERLTLTNFDAVKGADRFSTLTTGSNFAGPMTVAPNASIDFELKIGNSGTTKATITKAVVDAALANQSGYDGSGTIANAAQFALVVKRAMDNANISGLTVAADANRIRFTRTSAGSTSIILSNAIGKAAATRATLTTGSDFSGPVTIEAGASIGFDLAIDGNAAQTIRIERSTVEAALSGTAGYVAGSGTISTAAQLALVAQRALADKGIAGITVAAAGSRLTFTKSAAGAGSLTIGNAAATGTAALAASTRTGSDFQGPVTIAANAALRFDISLDGGAARTIAITRGTVDAALAPEAGYVAASGTIADAAQFAKVVGRALNEAGVGGILVAASGNRLVFTKSASGAGRITIGNAGSSAGASTASEATIGTIDVGSADFAALNASERGSVIDALVAGLDATTKDVVDAEAYLGSLAKRLDIQTSFLSDLQTIMTRHIDGLVKADIPEETARQKALDVRQQLALQALQILNQSQRNILQLFDRQD